MKPVSEALLPDFESRSGAILWVLAHVGRVTAQELGITDPDVWRAAVRMLNEFDWPTEEDSDGVLRLADVDVPGYRNLEHYLRFVLWKNSSWKRAAFRFGLWSMIQDAARARAPGPAPEEGSTAAVLAEHHERLLNGRPAHVIRNLPPLVVPGYRLAVAQEARP